MSIGSTRKSILRNNLAASGCDREPFTASVDVDLATSWSESGLYIVTRLGIQNAEWNYNSREMWFDGDGKRQKKKGATARLDKRGQTLNTRELA
jgi:hypothetical protein